MEDSNEYERLRQENILKNRELLLQLQLDAASVGATKKAAKSSSGSASKPKNRSVKKEPQSPLPRRKSSRLAGLPADSEIASEVAKRKYEEGVAALQEAERAKRARVAGDLSFEIKQGLVDIAKGDRFERTFTDENVQETTDKDLRAMRQKMMGLRLYDQHLPNGKLAKETKFTMYESEREFVNSCD